MSLKLYGKNLTSLEALRREQALLKAEASYKINHLIGEDKLSDDKNPLGASDIFKSGLDFITSSGATNKLMALALPAVKLASKKMEKNVLKTVGGEIIGGYLKWKAIEFGYRAILKTLKK